MKKVFVLLALLFFGAAHAQLPNSGGGAPGVPTNNTGGGGGNGGGAGAGAYNPAGITFLGDSRCQYQTVAVGNALTAQFWFNIANTRLGHRFILGTNACGSGCRSDQFLYQGNVNAAIADPGQYVFFNSPAANDIASAPQNGTAKPASVGAACVGNVGGTYPYTDANGNTVTAANVGAAVAQNVVNAAEQIIAAGKTVVLMEEPGTTNINTAALVGQLYDLNFRLRAYAAARPGRVLIWTANQAVWNYTFSGTAVGFQTNFMTDGVHYAPIGAYAQATAFINFWQGCNNGQCGGSPSADLSIANINFVHSATARSVGVNPLFTTLTGGSTGGCGTVTGNVPSGYTLSCTNAATTVTITSAASTWCAPSTGCGNDVTLAITTTGADSSVQLTWAAPAANYALTDFIYGGADITVASGSTNASCYMQTANVSVESGSSQQYDLFPNAAGNFGTNAYTYRLQSLAKAANPGSVTKSFLNPAIVQCAFSAAGNATITISRVYGAKAYIYNPATRAFSG